MGGVIGEILPLSVGIAVSPVPTLKICLQANNAAVLAVLLLVIGVVGGKGIGGLSG